MSDKTLTIIVAAAWFMLNLWAWAQVATGAAF